MNQLPIHTVRLFERGAPRGWEGCALLGEQHHTYKDEKGVLDLAFPFHAKEAHDPRKPIGYRIFPSFHAILSGEGLTASAKYSAEHAELQEIARDNLRLLAEIAPRSDAISPNERQDFELMRRQAENILSGKYVHDFFTLDLEYRHSPNVTEHIGSVVEPLLYWGPFVLVSTRIVSTLIGYPIIPSLFPEIFLAACLCVFLGDAMIWNRGFAPLGAKRFISPLYAFHHAREVTMARNIHDFIEERTDNEVLLATVGRSHVAGIAHLLTNRHGFTEVALPAMNLK
ncbi:MAG: hypothetical protein HY540_04340 [Deltaproteobacteria bacterium]|nr:hypothetical protein [Deltaproteobacteria bacterium]